MRNLLPIRPDAVWAAAVTLAVAVAGGVLTDVGPWYFGLRKPSWQPPDWVFAPAWTVIYTLSAMAAVLCWRGAPSRSARVLVVGAFLLNALLNVLWSALFFFWRRPDWALIEVIPLWLSVAHLLWLSRRFSPVAPWFLMPYLLWVGFAAVLNWAVVRLNAPFG
ncbi:MAG: TspO/MBR family protein [Rhodovarius sp.]|nr:tryptophan-rich sensory protein [Rhodovarius sp.]MCX7933189.1 tryptophan-rich sensory protein [Rhodovarius sp.]MDW8313984.1 TspO/MBR family protein [Rhodovarius sp.]